MLPGIVVDQLDGVLPDFPRVAGHDSFPGKLTGAFMVCLFGQDLAVLQIDGETQKGGVNRKNRPCDRTAERLHNHRFPGREPLGTG